MGGIMELVLFAAISVAVLWLGAIAVISEKPQASLARGILASGGVVAGAWISTAGPGTTALSEAPVLVSLFRMLG